MALLFNALTKKVRELFLLSLAFFLTFALSYNANAAHIECNPLAYKGVIDLACWDAKQKIALGGQWQVDIKPIESSTHSTQWLDIPSRWSEYDPPQPLKGIYTYQLNIKNMPVTDHMILHPGQWEGSLALFADYNDGTGWQLLFDNLDENNKPTAGQTPIYLHPQNSRMSLKIVLENEHFYSGNFSTIPQIYNQTFYYADNQRKLLLATILMGAFIGSAIFLTTFWIGLPIKLEFLALGLCSLTLGLRLLETQNLLPEIWPNASIYASSYWGWGTFYMLGVSWSLYFLLRFSQSQPIKWLAGIYMIISLIGLSLLVNPNLYIPFGTSIYRSTSIFFILMLFAFYILRRRIESKQFAGLSGLIVCIATITDIIFYITNNRIGFEFSSIAFLIMIISQSYYLSFGYGKSLKAQNKLTDELISLNLSLEEKVKHRTHEFEQANTQLRLLSLTDELTHLGNRRAFDLRLAEEIDRSIRHKHPLTLLYLDLDHFKEVNDKHGHQAGDEVLKAVSNQLIDLCRNGDFSARIGGEEFAVILPDTDLGALTFADRLQKCMRELLIKVDKEVLTITVSGGLASFNPEMNANQLKLNADSALYQAKNNGRDQIIHFQ